MKDKIIGIAIIVAVALAVSYFTYDAYFGGESQGAVKVEATQYSDEEATSAFTEFSRAAIGAKGDVLGAACFSVKKQADGTYAEAPTGPVYGCIVAVAEPGKQEVAECDQIVIRLVKPSKYPEVLAATAVDPKVCTG